jgi:hypothetical protein
MSPLGACGVWVDPLSAEFFDFLQTNFFESCVFCHDGVSIFVIARVLLFFARSNLCFVEGDRLVGKSTLLAMTMNKL